MFFILAYATSQTQACYGVFDCIIKATNKNYTKRDEFVSTAYYT